MILITYVTPTSKLTCEPYNITYNLGVPLCKPPKHLLVTKQKNE